MVLNDDIKQKIRSLLNEKSWTIATLAKRAKIPKQTLYNNLDLNIQIKNSTLQKISDAFGVTMDYWFMQEVNEKTEEYGNEKIKNSNAMKTFIEQIKFLKEQLDIKDGQIQFLQDQLMRSQGISNNKSKAH